MSDKNLLLWRVRFGSISSKPRKCTDLGDGFIKVVGDCRIKQKRDDFNESYHETYDDAMKRFVADAQRDVLRDQRNLKNSIRRLRSAQAKWSSYKSSRLTTQP